MNLDTTPASNYPLPDLVEFLTVRRLIGFTRYGFLKIRARSGFIRPSTRIGAHLQTIREDIVPAGDRRKFADSFSTLRRPWVHPQGQRGPGKREKRPAQN